MVAPVVVGAVRAGSVATRVGPRAPKGFVAPRRIPRVNPTQNLKGVSSESEERILQNTSRAQTLRVRNRMLRITADEKGAHEKHESPWTFAFFFVVGLAIMKDIVVDPALDLLFSGGLALTATVAGAVLGLPLAIIALVGKLAMSGMFLACAGLYFWMHGGVSSARTTSRFMLMGVGTLAESFPVLSILPITTLTFVGVVMLQHAADRSPIGRGSLSSIGGLRTI